MKISKEELENLSDKTISEIAERYGCAKQNISLWLKKYGLERRSIEIKPVKAIEEPPIKQMRLDLVSKILNGNAEFLSAIKTLLERK